MLNVSEIFYSIQGEIDVGVPTIFIRLAGCNMFPKCTWCDSKFSWKNGKLMSNEKIYEQIKDWLSISHYIVFTGGEPILQDGSIKKLMGYIVKQFESFVNYGIETNGLKYSKVLYDITNISVSPKKQNYNIKVLKKLNNDCARFKFVYEPGNLWFEEIIKKVDIENYKVYIMPEGMTKKEQENKMDEVVEYCKNKGYNFCPRIHTLIWGNVRKK